jgi:hypothetical protein
LRRHLGESPEALLAASLASAHLSANTVNSYGPKYAAFAAFCRERGLCPLPATTETVALYVAHLAMKGTVQPESVKSYLTPINTVHSSVLLLPQGPASGPLIKQVLQGWRQQRARLASGGGAAGSRRPQRVPLPASVALRALRAVLADAATAAAGSGASGGVPVPVEDLRALVYVALGFQLMARASTDASLLKDDVLVTNTHIRLQLRKEKGKDAHREFRCVQLGVDLVPDLAAAVRHWRYRHAMAWAAAPWGPARQPFAVVRGGQRVTLPPASAHFFLLPSDGAAAAGAAPSALCNRWLQAACARLGVAAPPGQAWLSHSLRSGAASAAAAEGVTEPSIRHWGGWARDSSAVKDYIDPSVTPDEASRVFFGWLSPLGMHVRRLLSRSDG